MISMRKTRDEPSRAHPRSAARSRRRWGEIQHQAPVIIQSGATYHKGLRSIPEAGPGAGLETGRKQPSGQG